MPILILVTHNPTTPTVYTMMTWHQRVYKVKGVGQGVIPDDVTVINDGELLLSHPTLKRTLILPKADATAALLNNQLLRRHPDEDDLPLVKVDSLDDTGLLDWLSIQNISDYPRGIKAFLAHCVKIEF
jgi:hypothetical protein